MVSYLQTLNSQYMLPIRGLDGPFLSILTYVNTRKDLYISWKYTSTPGNSEVSLECLTGTAKHRGGVLNKYQ